MSLIVGIGLRTDTPYRELRDLVSSALAEARSDDVQTVVTVDGKEIEPGLLRLVAALGAELHTAPVAELASQLVPTPNDKVEQLTGTASVAEAAVLAAGAELIVGKRRSPRATVAVGRLSSGPPQVTDSSP